MIVRVIIGWYDDQRHDLVGCYLCSIDFGTSRAWVDRGSVLVSILFESRTSD